MWGPLTQLEVLAEFFLSWKCVSSVDGGFQLLMVAHNCWCWLSTFLTEKVLTSILISVFIMILRPSLFLQSLCSKWGWWPGIWQCLPFQNQLFSVLATHAINITRLVLGLSMPTWHFHKDLKILSAADDKFTPGIEFDWWEIGHQTSACRPLV